MPTNDESRNLTPEAIIEILRALREQIGEFVPLTPGQRRELRHRVLVTRPILQIGINVIQAAHLVERSVGISTAEVQEIFDDSARWTAVEAELRALLNGISGANLVRRDRVASVARQAAAIATELARNPDHAELIPYAEEITRLKRIKRRRKTAPKDLGTP